MIIGKKEFGLLLDIQRYFWKESRTLPACCFSSTESACYLEKKKKKKKLLFLKISRMGMGIMFLLLVIVSSLAALCEATNCDTFSSRETEGYW